MYDPASQTYPLRFSSSELNIIVAVPVHSTIRSLNECFCNASLGFGNSRVSRNPGGVSRPQCSSKSPVRKTEEENSDDRRQPRLSYTVSKRLSKSIRR